MSPCRTFFRNNEININPVHFMISSTIMMSNSVAQLSTASPAGPQAVVRKPQRLLHFLHFLKNLKILFTIKYCTIKKNGIWSALIHSQCDPYLSCVVSL